MSRYEIGESYFLKARIVEIADGTYPLKVVVPVNTPLKSEYTNIYMANVPGILLTAEEICNGEDSCKRLKELDAVNHEQVEKILSLQTDLLTAKANYNSCSDELAECKKKLKEAEATIRTLTKKNRCLRKEADRGDVIAKALADTILDICDSGDLILEEG